MPLPSNLSNYLIMGYSIGTEVEEKRPHSTPILTAISRNLFAHDENN